MFSVEAIRLIGFCLLTD